jgi:hypothetical protein
MLGGEGKSVVNTENRSHFARLSPSPNLKRKEITKYRRLIICLPIVPFLIEIHARP